MKAASIAGILMLTLIPNLRADDAPAKHAPPAERKDSEEWVYTMKLKQPGTRSEVKTGELTRDGEAVTGKEGEVLETPYGKLQWMGEKGYKCGWQPYTSEEKKD